MSILIKGMKMPENCCDCPLETDYGTCGYYSLFVEGGHDSDWEKRRDDCPLIEIPDHGDLIDRDMLMAHKGSAYDIDGHELYAVGTGTILRMPVVIPAERSEE